MKVFRLGAGGFLILISLLSLGTLPLWRISHDSVLIHYITMLIDQFDYILYKDVFDTAFPGTFLLHLFIGKLFGYTESGLQIFNLIFASP